MLLVVLAGWIVFAYIFAEFAPIIFEGLIYLIGYLFMCLWQVIKLIATGIGWAIARLIRSVARGAYWGMALLYFIFDEWRRGPAAPHEEPPEDQPDDSAYEQALALLGLTPGFTQDALKRAYHKAMRTAHPDTGGSAQAAQEVNGAYDLILQVCGWQR